MTFNDHVTYGKEDPSLWQYGVSAIIGAWSIWATLAVMPNAFLALEWADWDYVMETGKIILQGEASTLLRNDQLGRD